MGRSHAGSELFLAQRNLLGEVSAEQGEVFRFTFALERDIHRQHGRKASNVVVPESSLDLGQVRFVQKSAVARRLQVDASHLHIQRVFLRSHEQVRADGAQLAIDLVADVGSHRNHRGGHGNTQGDGRAGQQFTPLLAAEGFVDKPREHLYCFSNVWLPAARSAS